MWRVLRIFVIVALFASAAVWFVENPGLVQVRWLGYEIETSPAFLFACGAILVWLVVALRRLFRRPRA